MIIVEKFQCKFQNHKCQKNNNVVIKEPGVKK